MQLLDRRYDSVRLALGIFRNFSKEEARRRCPAPKRKGNIKLTLTSGAGLLMKGSGRWVLVAGLAFLLRPLLWLLNRAVLRIHLSNDRLRMMRPWARHLCGRLHLKHQPERFGF